MSLEPLGLDAHPNRFDLVRLATIHRDVDGRHALRRVANDLRRVARLEEADKAIADYEARVRAITIACARRMIRAWSDAGPWEQVTTFERWVELAGITAEPLPKLTDEPATATTEGASDV